MRKSFLTMLLLPVAALCFDGQRQGFVIGGGGGVSLTSFTQTLDWGGGSMTTDRENEIGFATNLVLGYGISNTLLLNYFAHTNWFSITNANGDGVVIANGNAGVQLVKYLKDSGPAFVPSPYVYGGLGWSGWSTPFEENGASWIGLGASLGAGYEFLKHWAVQVGAFLTNPSDEEGGVKVRSNTIGIHLQLVGLAY